MVIKKIPSAVPYYACGIIWVLYAIFFPMYRLLDFGIVIILSAAVFFVCRIKFPGEEIKIETPLQTGDPELDEVYSKVFEFIQQMGTLNNAIKNQQMNTQIDEMETATKSILEVLKKEPDKIRQVRTFLNYYLPTTIKLLEAYRDLAAQEMPGENMKSSMEQIEGVMETISDGFKKELDSLFAGKAIDISAEIQVLESMLKDQGLSL